MVKQQKWDFIFYMSLFVLIVFIRSADNQSISQDTMQLAIYLLILYSNLYLTSKKVSLYLLLPSTFIVFFISFSVGDAMVNWSSYLVTGALATLMSGLTYLITKYSQKNYRSNRTFYWLIRKFPHTSKVYLSLIDGIGIWMLSTFILFMVTLTISSYFYIIPLLIAIYTTFTNLYFYDN